MATLSPIFTDVTVLAAVNVSAGNAARGTVDLTDKVGLRMLIQIGRGAAGDPTTPPTVAFYRRADGADESHGGPDEELLCSSGTAVESAIDTDAAAGDTAITVASASGFAIGDHIMIQNSDESFTRLEFNRIIDINTDTLTLAAPLRYAHTAAQGDEVSNRADCFRGIWLEGGSVYDILIDHTQGATHGVTARILGTRHDGFTIA